MTQKGPRDSKASRADANKSANPNTNHPYTIDTPEIWDAMSNSNWPHHSLIPLVIGIRTLREEEKAEEAREMARCKKDADSNRKEVGSREKSEVDHDMTIGREEMRTMKADYKGEISVRGDEAGEKRTEGGRGRAAPNGWFGWGK